MRKRAFLLLTVLILLITSVPISAGASYTPSFEVYSEAALLVNLDTGKVVYEKNADQKMYPASLTKIITTMIALENCEDLDSPVTVNQSAFRDLGWGYSNANLKPGEVLTMRQLLYATMVKSACEGSNIIAEAISGDINDFVDLMNQRCAELGCTNTHLLNPHGLHEDGHYTTARDLYRIVSHAMELPAFMSICSTYRYSMPETNMNPARTLVSTNLLMNPASEYYYEGVRGIKTGFTAEGERCLVTTASRNGYQYLLITLHAPAYDAEGELLETSYNFIDAINIYDWAFSSFQIKSLVDLDQPVGEVSLTLGEEADKVLAYPGEDFHTLIPADIDKSSILLVPELPETMEAPIYKGDQIGTAKLLLAGEEIGTIPLVAGQTVERSQFLYYMQKLNEFLGSIWFKIAVGALVGLILIYAVTTIIFSRRRKKRRTGK